MYTLLLIFTLVLWIAVLGIGFLLLGTLRSLGLVNWRLDQIEMTRPSRLGRAGLTVGKNAPDFTLPSSDGGDVSLSDFSGRKVLLVFTQSGCGPCHDIAPELNRLHDKGEHQIVVVNNGQVDDTRRWAAESKSRFPVLVQEKFAVSKRYEVFATPFAFLINEQGVITSKGIVGSHEYLGYVLSGAGNRTTKTHEESENGSTDEREPAENPLIEEIIHV